MKFTAFLLLFSALAWAGDGFVSLMPKRDIAEHWTVEGKAPRGGLDACATA